MRNRGFTLLETLIAMVMLSAGIILLANSWGGSFMRVRKTQLSTEVAALLERKMVEIQMEYRDKPLDSIDDEKSDDFGSEYPDFSWRMNSKAFEVPDLAASLTARDGGANQTLIMIIKQMTEHLSKSIREVKVTVIYKKGKKPMEFSATTYFVDYNRQLPMPGGAAGP